MSQIPAPIDPLPYASPAVAVPNPRPTSVTVIAIIAIIFGSIGVLGGLCSLPQYFGLQFGPNPVMDAMRNDSVLYDFLIINMVVGVILAAMELVGGVGMLSLKPSARTVMTWFAIISMVVQVVTMVLNLALIAPRMERAMQTGLKGNPAMSGPFGQIMHWGVYGGVIAGTVWLIWPILILYYLNRPHVKAAFEQGPLRK